MLHQYCMARDEMDGPGFSTSPFGNGDSLDQNAFRTGGAVA